MFKKKQLWLMVLASGALLAGCANYTDNSMDEAKSTTAEMSKSMQAKDMQAKDGSKFKATTSSDEAREHFNAGYGAYEMQRNIDAEAHFEKAIAADPGFAAAHLMHALVANSTEGFNNRLAKAGSYAKNASPGEQLLIKSFQKQFDGDQAGRLAKLKKLTAMHPDSARALMFEAQAHGAVNDTAAARAALKKAIKLDPTITAAHMQLGNAYMFMEPKNLDKAEKHFMKAAKLSPDEQITYDLLGDVHRQQGNMKAAYADYTKAAELAPTMGSPLQQRGHVNSFLGNFDEARSDYSRAAKLEDARGSNAGGFFMVFHSYVNLHEGNPAAAIPELKAIAAKADSMAFDGKMDLKINALFNAAQVATHIGDADQANSIITKLSSLLRQQAKELNSAEQMANAESNIAYVKGMLAARMGDTAKAQANAADFKRHVANQTSPRKLEGMHEILGMSAFFSKDYAGAVKHLAAGDVLNNMYTKYHLAVANEKSGNSDEAKRLFKELANWNFNGPGYAMTRKDILARVAKY